MHYALRVQRVEGGQQLLGDQPNALLSYLAFSRLFSAQEVLAHVRAGRVFADDVNVL